MAINVKSYILLLSILFLISFFIIPVSAGPLEDANAAGTWMVQKGLEGFVYSTGDAIYGIGGKDELTNRSDTDNLIIALLAWNVDPYAFKEVREWQDYSAAAFIILGTLAILIAFVFMKVNVQSLDELIGEGYTQNRIIDTLLILIVAPILSIFGVWVVLKLNYVVSVLIVDYMLMTIPRTSDNFLIYIFMALAFVLLSVLMFIRAIWIVVFVAVSIIVAVAYSITELRQHAIDYTYSFLSIVFLQPKLLLIMVLGIVVVSKLPQVIMNQKAMAYLALVLYLCWTGYKAIAGNAIVTAAKVIVLKRIR